MTRDIHAYIETCWRPGLVEGADGWSSFCGRLWLGQCNTLFDCLAGACGGPAKPLFEPRGVPNDMSWAADGDYLPSWHVPSWLTIEELEMVYAYYQSECKRLYQEDSVSNKPIEAVIAAMKALESDGSTVTRFVFWFGFSVSTNRSS